ncbi:CBS domain-containing protein [Mesorhizobium sp. M4B.F.Ca.ET.017.02.2.1]|uniref:CBS domain-containing protein n=1 Tax=Mesorhizobium sp. M4B.F.Ca.ET.017.02.2.1 TaxID=2496649 RepID=UPI000FCBF2DD|nr:CBS domain-containing protein [Mesorhizobium sp. M4B.F.Ca.ET.017.02.2.1]RVD28329.1 CBS domain-containing protein [Mesorhizobium sp. M4B.F.Ca.ET.017.02.2.1]
MHLDLDKPLDEYPDEEPILKELAKKLSVKGSFHSTTVRNFIWWFGAYRRGPLIVDRISESLGKYNLEAEPDFRTTYVDHYIKVFAKSDGAKKQAPKEEALASDATFSDFRISQLESANRTLITVAPNDPLEKAVSLMLAHDFSQLPVLNSARTIIGVISWKSIGSKLAVVGIGHLVKDFVNECTVVEHDRPIFEVYDLIYRDEFVVVRAEDRTFSGIVTTSDLADEFRKVSEAFLVLGEIERNIRRLLDRWNTLSEERICEICNIPKFDGFHKLTFGGYLRIIENDEFWSSIPFKLHRKTFVDLMDNIRITRNSVMHFNPDPSSEKELRQMRNFSGLLQKLIGFHQS